MLGVVTVSAPAVALVRGFAQVALVLIRSCVWRAPLGTLQLDLAFVVPSDTTSVTHINNALLSAKVFSAFLD